MEALKNSTITRSIMMASATIRQSAMGYIPAPPLVHRLAIRSKTPPSPPLCAASAASTLKLPKFIAVLPPCVAAYPF